MLIPRFWAFSHSPAEALDAPLPAGLAARHPRGGERRSAGRRAVERGGDPCVAHHQVGLVPFQVFCPPKSSHAFERSDFRSPNARAHPEAGEGFLVLLVQARVREAREQAAQRMHVQNKGVAIFLQLQPFLLSSCTSGWSRSKYIDTFLLPVQQTQS